MEKWEIESIRTPFTTVVLFAIAACFQPLGMEDQSIPKQNVKSSVQDNIFNAGLNYAGRNQFVGGVYKSG